MSQQSVVTLRPLCCGATRRTVCVRVCVKLNGEDLSRCSNKSESVGLRKCPHESLPHIVAGKQLAYEEITSLSPYVYRLLFSSRLLYAVARPSVVCRLSVCRR